MRRGEMKPDYKNWMPRGMVCAVTAAAAASLFLFVLFLVEKPIAGAAGRIFTGVFLLLTIVFGILGAMCLYMYRSFDWNGKQQVSRRIIDFVASRVHIPDGGTCLDVGCGSGALSIAVAKRNPKAKITGMDKWGKEYASFSKELCERNAAAEGVSNVTFQRGNAIKLDFSDETFDCLTSNYCYHNIPSDDRTELLRESLRVLKRGGTFVIHDLMTKRKYGDIQAFADRLKREGFQDVQLVRTSDGTLLDRNEAKHLMLTDSMMLTGRKS